MFVVCVFVCLGVVFVLNVFVCFVCDLLCDVWSVFLCVFLSVLVCFCGFFFIQGVSVFCDLLCDVSVLWLWCACVFLMCLMCLCALFVNYCDMVCFFWCVFQNDFFGGMHH